MKGTIRIINTLIICAKGYYLSLLFITIALTFYSCTNEDYFTEEELKIIDVYSSGDKFKMINTKNDTFTFIVRDRKIEKKKWNCAECFGPTKYEELIYELEIETPNKEKFSGKVSSSSLEEQLDLHFEMMVLNCSLSGIIEIPPGYKIDTLEVNGVIYPYVYCAGGKACFAKGAGFIRFNLCGDTLNLIK